MILITTAGKVGAEAARLLARRGAPVRVLVRNPEKVTALAQAGVDVCRGDLEVPATIDAAMRGVASVVLVSSAIPREEPVLGRSIVFHPITVAELRTVRDRSRRSILADLGCAMTSSVYGATGASGHLCVGEAHRHHHEEKEAS